MLKVIESDWEGGINLLHKQKKDQDRRYSTAVPPQLYISHVIYQEASVSDRNEIKITFFSEEYHQGQVSNSNVTLCRGGGGGLLPNLIALTDPFII